MNILAIDTCLGACSAALLQTDGEHTRLHADYEEMQRGHAEALMPMVRSVLSAGGVRVFDLDRVCVTLGPGTFTGVRVGIAAARGLVLGTPVATVGARSTQVIADQVWHTDAPAGQALAVVANAGRGHVFLEIFDDRDTTGRGPAAISVEDAATLLRGFERLTLAGSAAASIAALQRRADWQISSVVWPSASTLARLGPSLAKCARSDLKPLYLRPPDAKPQVGAAIERLQP